MEHIRSGHHNIKYFVGYVIEKSTKTHKKTYNITKQPRIIHFYKITIAIIINFLEFTDFVKYFFNITTEMHARFKRKSLILKF